MQNIAIVGFKFMGTTHAQVLQSLDHANLAAIVDRNPSQAAEYQKSLGLKLPVYPSLKSLLSEVEVDAIDICVPTDAHLGVALEAISAGKHLFCEKPLTLNMEDAQTLCEAVQHGGVMAQVGHCIRFWPEYQALAGLVQSRIEGKLLSLDMKRRSARPPNNGRNWLNHEECSGGAALDLHIHDTDFISSLFGTPQAVTSIGTKDETGWSQIHTLYHYEDVAAAAEGGWNSPSTWEFQMAFRAVFERATVDYDSRSRPTLSITREGEETQPLPFGATPLDQSASGLGNITDLGGYRNELGYFIDCLERGESPLIATPEQAMESLRIVLAEIQSAELGRTIRLS